MARLEIYSTAMTGYFYMQYFNPKIDFNMLQYKVVVLQKSPIHSWEASNHLMSWQRTKCIYVAM